MPEYDMSHSPSCKQDGQGSILGADVKAPYTQGGGIHILLRILALLVLLIIVDGFSTLEY